jgi:hypothetical protein
MKYLRYMSKRKFGRGCGDDMEPVERSTVWLRGGSGKGSCQPSREVYDSTASLAQNVTIGVHADQGR